MRNFNWDDFRRERVVVHCPTEELAIDFCRQSHNNGINWAAGESRAVDNFWYKYKSDTLYYNNRYHSLSSYTGDGRVIKWELDSQTKKEKVGTSMSKDMFGMNFEFGVVDSDSLKVSPNGIAFATSDGRYCTFANGELVDVTEMTFDFEDAIYQMPCPTAQIVVGDIIKHGDHFVIVQEIVGNMFNAIDPHDGTVVMVIHPKSMFGFNYITKVVNMFDGGMMGGMMGGMFGAPTGQSASNPMGGMMQMMMMSKMMKGGSGDSDGFAGIMKMQMMMGMMQGMQGGTLFNPTAPSATE